MNGICLDFFLESYDKSLWQDKHIDGHMILPLLWDMSNSSTHCFKHVIKLKITAFVKSSTQCKNLTDYITNIFFTCSSV